MPPRPRTRSTRYLPAMTSPGAITTRGSPNSPRNAAYHATSGGATSALIERKPDDEMAKGQKPTGSEAETRALQTSASPPEVHRFRLTVTSGPDKGTTWESRGERCSIGSQTGN